MAVTRMLDILFRGRRVVFDSPLGIDEITRRLEREVAAPVWPRPRVTERSPLFEGTFASGRFRMMRRVRGRNSLRPLIEGQLSSAATGARITVKLRVHPVVLGIAFVLLAIGVQLLFTALGDAALVASYWPAAATVSLVLIIAVIAAAGRAEIRTSTRLLAELFETDPLFT